MPFYANSDFSTVKDALECYISATVDAPV